MSHYTVIEIAEIVNGKIFSKNVSKTPVKNLLTDSRKNFYPDHSIFIAIKTNRNNGHKYVDELYKKGLKNFLVSEITEEQLDYDNATFIKVDNTLAALQTLAGFHRKQFKIPVIGITGSNGKTIVKEWLFQLLLPDLNISRSPKSYNSQIGVPLSIWQINTETQLAIIEAGISEPGEMIKLQPVIQPTIGIFTNIGSSHEKNFLNIRQKAGEKLHLFSQVETLIYCSDYYDIQERIIQSEILKKIKLFTWSSQRKADLEIKKITKSDAYTSISAIFNSEEILIKIPFADNASVENAIHCWAYMLLSGYSNSVIAERMEKLITVAMRLELKDGINHCSVINDSYSSDLNSLSIALDFLNQQNQHHRKTLILSDILQSSLNDNDLYFEVAELLKNNNVSRIIGIGKSLKKHENLFDIEKIFYDQTDDFLNKFNPADFQNETILIKGARVFEFENISRLLQKKSHETLLEINLNSLIQNLNFYRSKLKSETKIMAMVKAFSYGSGGFEIANVLQYHNVDYLAVAYADEGIELRKSGIKTPIMVMNPEIESIELMMKYKLEPEIYSFNTLQMFINSYTATESFLTEKQPVHIKIDTGMNRLGFLFNETDDLLDMLEKNPFLEVKSVFTHLACSENQAQDDFTLEQIRQLEEVRNKFISKLGTSILAHVLNSSGIQRFPQAQFDMVRLGIGLYGISMSEEEQSHLNNVSTLRSTISQIKKVTGGSTVGYSRAWTAPKDSTIAIIPIGYADGLSRYLGNGNGCLYIHGEKAPIIGNICMDMCMIDITGLKAAEGDNVYVFFDAASIKEIAHKLGTIPYEILTSVSGRVKRVYYYE